MKALIQHFTRTALLTTALLIAGWCHAGETDQILFLHLKLKDGAIQLVTSAVKPGRLKTPLASEKKGEVFLELMTTNGAAIWSDVLADPTVQRFEYEDPDHPGALKIKEVKVPEAEFTVRVPVSKFAQVLQLHRLDRPANRADAAAPGRTKKLLGRLAIPRGEDAP